MGSGHGWLAGDWPSTGGVLNITAAAWTAGLHWWHSGNITRKQNVSEYMLVLALCIVNYGIHNHIIKKCHPLQLANIYRICICFNKEAAINLVVA